MRSVPVARQQRNPPQVEHHQDISVRQFVLEAKANDVELRKGGTGIKRGQGQSTLTEKSLHVDPRRIDALRLKVGTAVQQVIQDLQTQVGLGNFVDLRKGERETQPHLRRILHHGTAFSPSVAGGLIN